MKVKPPDVVMEYLSDPNPIPGSKNCLAIECEGVNSLYSLRTDKKRIESIVDSINGIRDIAWPEVCRA